jgi:hypothetical protein
MSAPDAAFAPPPSPPARVTEVRDYLLALLREPPDPVLPAHDLAHLLRGALGLLKFLELADVEARLVALERTALELKRQPFGRAGD